MDLAGKAAIVTGGSTGIGFAIAAHLAQRGVRIMMCARHGTDVDAAVARLGGDKAKVMGRSCDVRDLDEVTAMVDATVGAWDRLDIVVNNAGVGHLGSFEDLTVEQWHDTIDTNLTGVFNVCRAALPALKASGGHIVNMGSRSSRNPNPQSIFYTASKFGLLGFSEALALDLRRHGVRVTSILPGIVATEFAGVGVQPWQLLPEDVAKAVADVLSFDARVLPTIVELRPARQPS